MIKIYSHPRSGTNYLAHLIGINLYPGIDLSTKGGYVGHWNDRVKVRRNPYGKLFGGHGLPKRYKIDKNENKDHYSIYIYRDGREVALSLWNSPHFTNPDWKKSGMTFSEFIRTPLDWVGSPGSKAKDKHPKLTIFEHWKRHIDEWDSFVSLNVYLMSYHYLLRKTEAAIGDIARSFEITMTEFKNVTNRVGWFPSTKGINNPELSSDDNELFFDTIGTSFFDFFFGKESYG